MKIIGLIFFIGIYSFADYVGVATPTSGPIAKLVQNNGSVELVFNDGRMARLVVFYEASQKNVQLPIQVVENSCYPEKTGRGCYWTFNNTNGKLAFVWTSHPEPNKINQVVTVRNKNQTTTPMPPAEKLESENKSSLSDLDFFKSIDDVKNQPPMKLTCDDDGFLENLPWNSTTQSYLVPSWNVEFMSINSITNRTENQSLIQLNGAELKKVEQKTYQIVIPPNTTSFRNIVPLFDPQTIYYLDKQGQCSLQIKTDVSKVTEVVRETNKYIGSAWVVLPNGIPKNAKFDSVFFNLNKFLNPNPSYRDNYVVE